MDSRDSGCVREVPGVRNPAGAGSDWSVLDPRSSRRLGAGGADTTCSALETAGRAVVLRTCVYRGHRFCRRAGASAAQDLSAGWEASPCRSPARIRSNMSQD